MATALLDSGRHEGLAKRADHRRTNARLLRTARHIVWEQGYAELSMSSLAKAAECARKTVYNHFDCVEDILLSLCAQSTRRRVELASRAAMYKASTRERIVAIGSVLQALLPYHLRHECLLFSIHPRKGSENLRTALRLQEQRFHSVAAGVFRAAVANGDLDLAGKLTPESLALTLNELYVGHYAVVQRGFVHGTYTREESRQAMNWLTRTLWDDLGWRPLFDEIDYRASMRRMWKEVFPELLEAFDIDL